MAIIGIDLGTSNSAAAVLRGGRPVIIPSSEGVSLGGKAAGKIVIDNLGCKAGHIKYMLEMHDAREIAGYPVETYTP